MMTGSDWGWGLLMMLIWSIVLIAAVVLIIRFFSDSQYDRNKSSDAISIAKERYAKGDITKKEFDQIKKDLISR